MTQGTLMRDKVKSIVYDFVTVTYVFCPQQKVNFTKKTPAGIHRIGGFFKSAPLVRPVQHSSTARCRREVAVMRVKGTDGAYEERCLRKKSNRAVG
jgi:hypothetical protein